MALYDIKDLMTRPILLAMITDTVVFGGLDIGSKSVRGRTATLYQLYTALQFDRDWEKGDTRRRLSTRERRLFTQMVALTMFANGTLEVTYNQILGLVRSSMRLPEIVQLFTEDTSRACHRRIRCTFFNRDGNKFRFVHKSFVGFSWRSGLRRK